MNLDEIARRLPYFLDAGVCVEITGPSGIGKSDMIEQVVDKLSARDGFEWGLGRHFFATYTPPDVTGYLSMYESDVVLADGTKQRMPISHFSQPPWMLDDNGKPLNSFKRGICVGEEYDKALPEVKKAFAPVQLYGGVADWRFHAGIGIVLLTNDASSNRQGSTKDFDFTINRKITLSASTSVQGWLNWADSHDVHPMFKAFAEEHPETVFSGTVPEKQGPFCTPRSLVQLQKVARFMMDPDGHVTDQTGMMEISAGAIGSPATRDLMTFLQLRDEVPRWAEIVKSPRTAKIPDNQSGQLMAAHLAAYNVDEKTMEPGIAYARRLRPEVHIVFVKAVARRNFRLCNTKPFDKWTNEEPQLVALLNALGGAG